MVRSTATGLVPALREWIRLMALTFFTNPQSRGRIVRWMLEEVGEPYETVILPYGEAMKSPEFLALNPMGKVPTIRHDGTAVSESAAICAYLADVFPAAGLAPPPAERGAYYRAMFFAAGPLEAAITARTLKLEPPAERAQSVGFGSFDATVAGLEALVAQHDFIAGPKFSAADVYLGSQVIFALMFDGLPKTPTLEAYLARIAGRDALRRANEIDDALAN